MCHWLDTPAKLNIRVRCKKGADSSLVEILHEHNHIVHIERNGEVLYDIPHSLEDVSESGTDRSCLSLEKIVSYGATADLSGLYEVLDKQRFLNTVLHLFGSLFQLHFFQLGHHSFRFFTGGLLAFLGMDRLEHLGH